MMPLTMTQPGETVKLVALRGGHQMRKRLADLGLTLDMPLRLVQGNGHGPSSSPSRTPGSPSGAGWPTTSW
jgi:Fe2+ transport system protein FeoA